MRIDSASCITVGESLDGRRWPVYADAYDWHDIYDVLSRGRTSRSTLQGGNVWIGDEAIVCKGDMVGDNSIIGAGSVVTQDIPSNVIAMSNPAKYCARPRPGAVINHDALCSETERRWRNAWMRAMDLADKTWSSWLRRSNVRRQRNTELLPRHPNLRRDIVLTIPIRININASTTQETAVYRQSLGAAALPDIRKYPFDSRLMEGLMISVRY